MAISIIKAEGRLLPSIREDFHGQEAHSFSSFCPHLRSNYTEYLICPERDAYDDESVNNMTLEINGESREVSQVSNVRELLELLGIAEGRVAVEVNRQIIRRADWEKAPISNLDHVEIVQFVGGG
jgi:sulfur carrier protein